MKILELNNCGYRYPDQDEWVFSNLDFSIQAGKIARVVGRNGAGKTTFIKILSGQLKPTAGELKLFDGAQTVYMDQNASAMVAHDLTIYEQICMAAPTNKFHSKIHDEVSFLLKKFDLGLELELSKFVGQLSGGQKQIVSLLCALIGDADIICLDELFSALDKKSSQIAYLLIEYYRSNKSKAIVFSSHIDPKFKIDLEYEIEHPRTTNTEQH